MAQRFNEVFGAKVDRLEQIRELLAPNAEVRLLGLPTLGATASARATASADARAVFGCKQTERLDR